MPISFEEVSELSHELQAATKRLGPPRNILRWFVKDFLNTNPKELSPHERALVSYNLFAAAGEHGQIIERAEFLKEPLSVRDLARVQQWINSALTALLNDNLEKWTPPGPATVVVRRMTPVGSKEPVFVYAHDYKKRVNLALSGFTDALVTAGNHLRACKRCKRPLVANMRQEYCSSNCSQIVRNEKKKLIKEQKKS